MINKHDSKATPKTFFRQLSLKYERLIASVLYHYNEWHKTSNGQS